jgi:D-alanine-D-alanine ligase
MKVLVIFGGDSAEREISLKSGAAVGKALLGAGYEVSYCDPLHENILEHIKDIDVVFPILHGGKGESGELQKILEVNSVKFVGSGSEASANCFDKLRTAQIAGDIQFPKSEVISKENFENSELLKNPFVIKPKAEGSSVDTFIVRDPSDFKYEILETIFPKYNNELLLQELIEGIEVTVPIIGEQAFPVVEIIPPEGKEFDFVNKYNGQTAENCPPKLVSESTQKKAQDIAIKLHNLMGCRDISRTDLIVDKNENLVCLEINTLPGMTDNSLVPLSARQAGLSMPQLVDKLVKLALARS